MYLTQPTLLTGKDGEAEKTKDGSSLSEAVLEPAAQLVAALSAPSQGALHLLRIVNVPATSAAWRSQANIGSEMSEHMKQEAKAYLTCVVDRLRENTALDYMYELTEAELTITALPIRNDGWASPGCPPIIPYW